jgi:hypothetical protein
MAILILENYVSLNQDKVAGLMIFVAQTALFMSAKLE